MIHFIIVAAYLISFLLVHWVVAPVQAQAMRDPTIIASVIFLPHGVRVLSAMLVGWRSVPALWAAHALGMIFIWEPGNTLHLEEMILLSSVGATSAHIVWSAMQHSGIGPAAPTGVEINWRLVILVGAVASFLNSIGTVAVISLVHPGLVAQTSLTQISYFALGDTIGVFALLLLLILLRRLWRMSNSGVM